MSMRLAAIIIALAIIVIGIWWLSTQQTGTPVAPSAIDQETPTEPETPATTGN